MQFIKNDYVLANVNANDSLYQLILNLKRTSSMISNYCLRANKVLSGNAYSMILGRLDVYSQACDYLSNTIDVLLNNITSGNNSVINAMEDFSEISDEKLQEIESQLARQKSLLNSISTDTKSEDTTSGKNESSSEATEKSNEIDYATIGVLEAEKKKIQDALLNTQSADNQAAGTLTDVGNVMGDFEGCFVTKI